MLTMMYVADDVTGRPHLLWHMSGALGTEPSLPTSHLLLLYFSSSLTRKKRMRPML
jgi:hypothetical protein